MQELSQTLQRDFAWGSVCNLADKISDVEQTIDGGWDELIEMVAEAITDEGTVKSTSVIFSYLFNFLYNLLFRIKTNPVKQPFNVISKLDGAYRITNYDYKSFKWAKSNELSSKITTEYIDIPAEKLSDSQKKTFDERCE